MQGCTAESSPLSVHFAKKHQFVTVRHVFLFAFGIVRLKCFEVGVVNCC